MEKLNIINIDDDNEIFKSIVDVLLGIFPIVDDRTDILFPPLGHAIPELEIHFDFYQIDDEDITQILFLGGSSMFKCTVPDRVIVNKLLSKDVISKFIEYLLTDHDIFKNIIQFNNIIELPMTINLCEQNMCGISCGDIILKFDFDRHPNCVNMLNDYLKFILTSFRDKLKDTETFKREFSKYCETVKNEFVNSLTLEQLKDFINLFDIEDLHKIISDLPDERFIQLYEQYKFQENGKQLTKLLDNK